MRKLHSIVAAIVSAFILGYSPAAVAQAAGSATVINDCAKELREFCANVRPGAGRPIACLIAHEDKISPRCRLTAYLATGTLGDRLAQLQSMAKICSSDIHQYCSRVPPGGGRIYDCLKKNRATLLDDCRNGLPRFEALLVE